LVETSLVSASARLSLEIKETGKSADERMDSLTGRLGKDTISDSRAFSKTSVEGLKAG
jgi:hypothetical protein